MKNFSHRALALILILGIAALSFSYLQAETAPTASGKKVNINTASSAELEKLPRIGPKVAQRIIDFRKEHGNFKKIEELMKVKGIGEKTFEQLKDRITVAEPARKE